MERKSVELISVLVKCPEAKIYVEIPVKKLSFRGWEQGCVRCGSHGGADMDIGVCPACGKTHPVTILMEY